MDDIKADTKFENTTVKPVSTILDLQHSQIEKNDVMNATTLEIAVTEKFLGLKTDAEITTDNDLDYDDEMDEVIDNLIYNWLAMTVDNEDHPSCLMNQNSKNC